MSKEGLQQVVDVKKDDDRVQVSGEKLSLLQSVVVGGDTPSLTGLSTTAMVQYLICSIYVRRVGRD
jgi:hypothetical protein